MKELEKAIKVYWDAKDRLPPRVCHKPYPNVHITLCVQSLIVSFIDVAALFLDKNYNVFMKQAVKIDRNIETDLAYALKAKECPHILFLRGNRILYREKGDRLCINAVFLFF